MNNNLAIVTRQLNQLTTASLDLNDIAPEIVAQIADYLDPPSALRFAKTNAHFRDIVYLVIRNIEYKQHSLVQRIIKIYPVNYLWVRLSVLEYYYRDRFGRSFFKDNDGKSMRSIVKHNEDTFCLKWDIVWCFALNGPLPDKSSRTFRHNPTWNFLYNRHCVDQGM